MTAHQITQVQHNIYTLLSERKLKETFTLLASLIEQLQNWTFKEKLEELESSYKYMIQYMLEGVPDPERNRIYEHLILSAYTLTDKVTDLLMEKESSTLYYGKKRYNNTLTTGLQKSIEETDNTLNSISLNKLLNKQDLKTDETLKLQRELEQNREILFSDIWTNFPATQENYDTLRNALAPGHFPVSVSALIVSALLLNLLHRYDEQKLLILLETYNHPDLEIRWRGLTASLILLYIHRTRINLSVPLRQKIAAFKEEPGFNNDVRSIFLQLIKSRETEKISKKMADDILTEMNKISPDLYRKIRQDETMNDTQSFDKNPEWQEIFEQTGMAEKLKELNDLQMEGADVFMSTFSNLKVFPFFNEIENWFLPFDIRHSTLERVFTNDPKEDSFKKILQSSTFLCNSDKYSFCLSLSQVPTAQREMMMSQFSIEGLNMQELEKEESFGKLAGNGKNISNQYIQDLYRFFKLFPRRNEFTDPFSTTLHLYEVDMIKECLSDPDSLRLIAEFYFKKEYYTEALELFEILSASDQINSELYQKIGYCHQMSNHLELALDAYLKAETIYPDSFWTIRRIATCYRNLKKPDQALEYYRRAEQLKPDNLSIEMNIGHCYLEQKMYAEALKHYFKIDYLDPKSSKSWRPIAWCSFLTGKSEQAQRYYEKVIADKPSAQDFLNAGHVEFSLNNIRQAIAYYKKSIETDGYNIDHFLKWFKQDTPELVAAGIPASDIPIMLDQIMYSIDK